MTKKKKNQTFDEMQKQLQQKGGIIDAMKIIQEFEKLQLKPRAERQTDFSRYSKGAWESPRYFSQR